MDYDFSRLSTRSFEQLIQALSLSIIGPGVTIFGDGPDGGREATFEGMSNFPDKASPWKGYGIIQAKFRQRSGPGDAKWALEELKKELEKISTSTTIRKPESYIYATNAIFTPVADKGSKDKATALIKKYQKKSDSKIFEFGTTTKYVPY